MAEGFSSPRAPLRSSVRFCSGHVCLINNFSHMQDLPKFFFHSKQAQVSYVYRELIVIAAHYGPEVRVLDGSPQSFCCLRSMLSIFFHCACTPAHSTGFLKMQNSPTLESIRWTKTSFGSHCEVVIYLLGLILDANQGWIFKSSRLEDARSRCVASWCLAMSLTYACMFYWCLLLARLVLAHSKFRIPRYSDGPGRCLR